MNGMTSNRTKFSLAVEIFRSLCSSKAKMWLSFLEVCCRNGFCARLFGKDFALHPRRDIGGLLELFPCLKVLRPNGESSTSVPFVFKT